MRLIDADALGIGKAKREAFTVPEYADGWNSAIEIIDKAPTIDIDRPTQSQFKHMAVQLGYEKIVHCKGCQHWGNEETKVATVCEFPRVQLFCVCDVLKRQRKAGNCMTNEDFFCAHGERRTDEQ